MKKCLIIIEMMLLSALSLYAQQGEIIVTDFDPDLSVYEAYDSLWVDFDNDGSGDMFLCITNASPGYYLHIVSANNWKITDVGDDGNDTLSTIANWNSHYIWLDDESQDRFAARKSTDNGNLYVWFRAYWYTTYDPFYCHLCFDKYAYCTIPDYPLVWGQTELLAIKENDYSTAFATVHPNPTTGLVTIAGENLRQAEVLNMLGQQVLSVQGESNELRIDMAALPAGVYFVNVTNDEGRKCVRKVVKE